MTDLPTPERTEVAVIADALAAHLTARYGYSEVDPMAAAIAVVAALRVVTVDRPPTGARVGLPPPSPDESRYFHPESPMLAQEAPKPGEIVELEATPDAQRIVSRSYWVVDDIDGGIMYTVDCNEFDALERAKHWRSVGGDRYRIDLVEHEHFTTPSRQIRREVVEPAAAGG